MIRKINNDQEYILSMFCESHNLKLHKGYSGRGMYGKMCIGFSGENLSEFKIGFLLNEYLTDKYGEEGDDFHVLKHLFLNTSAESDSFGLGRIIYFPQVSLW